MMTLSAPFMSGWGWVICSVISAVFSAAIYLVNQYLRQQGDYLVFWMRVAVVVVMAPFMRGIALPSDPKFYVAVGLTVAAAVFSDVRTFNVSAKYGGGVVSRVQPLLVWGAFFLWFPFEPGLLKDYAMHPVNTGLILLSLAGCVYFANHQSKCKISKAALNDMLPALAGYSVTAVFNKYAMGLGSLEGVVTGYMFVQSLMSIPLMGAWLLWREKRGTRSGDWRTKKMLLAALLTAAAWLGIMVFKNVAMAYTPNPSYQAALSLTAPLFVSLFYLAVKHKEEADVRAGFGVIACAVLLALVTVR